MPSPFITIDNPNVGVATDLTTNSGFATMFACDIHKQAGVFRPAKRTVAAGDDSIFNTDGVTPADFEIYDGAGVTGFRLYAIAQGGQKIYQLDPGTDTWVNIHSIGFGVTAATGIKQFGTSLYWVNAVPTSLGRLNGDPTVPANWTDNYQFFSPASFSNYWPMVTFAGSLYIGSDRYVAKLEADEVSWDNEALTLPFGTRIREMTVWNDYIVISYGFVDLDPSGGTAGVWRNEGLVALWDGVSEFPEVIVETDGVLTSMINYNNRLMGFSRGRIYVYNGADFEIVTDIPGEHFDDIPAGFGDYAEVSASALWRENVIFAQSTRDNITSDNRLKAGIWTFGRKNQQFPFSVTHTFEPRTGNVGGSGEVDMKGIFVWGGDFNEPGGSQANVYFSYFDQGNSTRNVDRLDISQGYANSTYLVTVPYEISEREDGRLIKGVKLEFAEALNTSNAVNQVTVKYRLDKDIDITDDTTNWTTLGTIDNDPNGSNNIDDILYGVYKKAFRAQFRFELRADGVNADLTMGITRIHIY